MPLCGFNNKMLKGLASFMEGLVEYGLLERAKKNGETLNQAIQRELSDMLRFQEELPTMNETSKRILTEGLVRFASGFYLILREKGTNSIEQEYKNHIRSINNYFFEMDEMYYAELEGKASDMKELVDYLASIPFKTSKQQHL